MSDHEAEAWDDLLFGRGYDEDGKTCNRCGESHLHWIEVSGKWRLADGKEELHTCKRNNL